MSWSSRDGSVCTLLRFLADWAFRSGNMAVCWSSMVSALSPIRVKSWKLAQRLKNEKWVKQSKLQNAYKWSDFGLRAQVHLLMMSSASMLADWLRALTQPNMSSWVSALMMYGRIPDEQPTGTGVQRDIRTFRFKELQQLLALTLNAYLRFLHSLGEQ